MERLLVREVVSSSEVRGDADRLDRFGSFISRFYDQSWRLTARAPLSKSMWIAADRAGGVTIGRGFTLPMSAEYDPTEHQHPLRFCIFSSTRPFSVVAGGREFAAGGDDIAVLSSRQACRITCDRPHFSALMSVEIPESDLMDFEGRSGWRLSSTDPAAVMLRQTQEIAWKLSEQGGLEAASKSIARVCIDLLRISEATAPIFSGREEAGGEVRDALVWRAKRYIEANIQDPDLSVAQVAGSLNVSPRRLQSSFAERGERPLEFIRKQRALRAALILESEIGRTASLTEIAFDVGYKTPSRFSCEFRKAFGQTPREFRDAGIQAPLSRSRKGPGEPN